MTLRPTMSPEQRERARGVIMTHVEGNPRPRRRRRLLLVIGFSLVGALGLSAAAWVVLAPLAVREREAWCFSQADTSSHYVTALLSAQDAPDVSGRIALSECAAIWASGIETGQPADSTGEHLYPVPPLVLCLRGDGTFAVFPDGAPAANPRTPTRARAEHVCATLGLDTPSKK